MSALALTVTDSATMLRRSLRHIARYPAMTFIIVGMPVVFLLIFVYVLGGTLGAGLGHLPGAAAAGHAATGRSAYVSYVTPGIVLLTVATAATATAVAIAMDMTTGIIARFRTMAISRAAVLTGQVLGRLIQSLLSIALVFGIAVLIGFRTDASLLAWLAVAGVLAVVTLAVIWLGVALGLAAKNVEMASNLPMFLLLLPFLGSGFVPTQSMPAGLRWFAEYQPFTPVIQTVRGLLAGTPIGSSALTSLAWFAGLGLVAYLWSRKLYARDPRPVAG
jgi:ABC-2 type transport system permease protein